MAALEGKRPSTCKSYIESIKRCLEITESATVSVMLNGRARSYNKLAMVYTKPTTLKTRLASMCAVISANHEFVTKGCAVYWSTRLDKLGEICDKLAADKTASPELQAKWIEYELIKSKVHLLLESDWQSKARLSQDVVLLSMYSFLPPKRSDLGAIKIVSKLEDIGATENGIMIPTLGLPGQLVLNSYKTVVTYGQFVEELPLQLTNIIRASLEAHPRSLLLYGPGGKSLTNASYAVRVKSTMLKHLDSELTVNDLRHLYVTQREAGVVSEEQRAADAYSMMHSIEVHLDYVRNRP